ncbi:hypothetical protein C8R43DRAFT_958114 [Mycena crocata]|nr:hypothetical protein C8R43DRAFT_958114 [Mycena crocata]
MVPGGTQDGRKGNNLDYSLHSGETFERNERGGNCDKQKRKKSVVGKGLPRHPISVQSCSCLEVPELSSEHPLSRRGQVLGLKQLAKFLHCTPRHSHGVGSGPMKKPPWALNRSSGCRSKKSVAVQLISYLSLQQQGERPGTAVQQQAQHVTEITAITLENIIPGNTRRRQREWHSSGGGEFACGGRVHTHGTIGVTAAGLATPKPKRSAPATWARSDGGDLPRACVLRGGIRAKTDLQKCHPRTHAGLESLAWTAGGAGSVRVGSGSGGSKRVGWEVLVEENSMET